MIVLESQLRPRCTFMNDECNSNGKPRLKEWLQSWTSMFYSMYFW